MKGTKDYIFLLPIFLLKRNTSIWLLKTVKKQHTDHAINFRGVFFFQPQKENLLSFKFLKFVFKPSISHLVLNHMHIREMHLKKVRYII